MQAWRTERPWGYFDTFVENAQATVKTLTVLAGESTSLQRHRERDELWFVMFGIGKAILGDEAVVVKPGDFLYVPKGKAHRMKGITDVTWVEVSVGQFDEGDIERLDDRYGRV